MRFIQITWLKRSFGGILQKLANNSSQLILDTNNFRKTLSGDAFIYGNCKNIEKPLSIVYHMASVYDKTRALIG